MNQAIAQLEPQALWLHFAALNAVPRASKQEHKAIAFMRDFGQSLGLQTTVDDVGNVIIRKPASPGLEGRIGVVLQGHLDMVHQKNAGTDFDFDTQGIEMYVDEDWVKARGTTLGADNGIGVAAAMAVLAADDIQHPAIEALFTVDEETGMTGAKGLRPGILEGGILLNLDSEDDEEITIGCAGGVDVTVTGRYAQEAVRPADRAYRLRISGLTGGHSGMDIHIGRANANRLLNRLLLDLSERFGARIGLLDAGGLRNAIPREAAAVFMVAAGQVDGLAARLAEQTGILKAEYGITDPDLEIILEAAPPPATCMAVRDQGQLLRVVAGCPDGIHRMSADVDGLVQTSNNLARVRVMEGEYLLSCLTRGSVDSEKMRLAEDIRGLFELIGATVQISGAYPGWKPVPDAPIVQQVSALYREMFGAEAPIMACHAGLECGILGRAYPGMQMVSFGPNIRGAHSPDEKVQISSVQKFWRFFLQLLQRIPDRAAGFDVEAAGTGA
jgi:dipeptidase D